MAYTAARGRGPHVGAIMDRPEQARVDADDEYAQQTRLCRNPRSDMMCSLVKPLRSQQEAFASASAAARSCPVDPGLMFPAAQGGWLVREPSPANDLLGSKAADGASGGTDNNDFA